MIEYKKLDFNFSMNGKLAVVTGGAAGIGYASCEVLASKGANITILDINLDIAKKASESIAQKYGVKTCFAKVDVREKASVEAAIDGIIKDFGTIDILLNSAGVALLDDAENISEKYWKDTMDINLTGVFFTSQVVGNYMIKQGYGKIINMASQAGLIALDNHVAYCASKAAIISMTKVLAYEWAPFGINVNAISPTVVLTELGEKAWAGEVGEKMKTLIPNRRFGYPDEVAAIVLFLASNCSDMINGENIVMDGGYTIY